MSLQWLIIGGGIHGVHLAARLLGDAGLAPESVRILDPAESLLARWRTCTTTTGMTHLRSPAVHNLDLSPWSLTHFAGKKRRKVPRGLFAPPYNRPALHLFNSHCDRVIERYGLAALHIQDRATRCRIQCDGVQVETAAGDTLTAERVVLAIGAGEQPRWPAWAPRDDARVQHVFAPGFDGWPEQPERVAVVGAGISAAQIALRLARGGHTVEMVSRHALRAHQFDSDPGWLGPRSMNRFASERDPSARRQMIDEARHAGSVPPQIERALRQALGGRFLSWHQTEGITRLDTPPGQPLRLHLTEGEDLEVDRVLLATGFESRRPGGALVDELIESAGLPCAECGYPLVDHSLLWHPRIFVSGPLAELELGPTARNIAGARRAGDKLMGLTG